MNEKTPLNDVNATAQESYALASQAKAGRNSAMHTQVIAGAIVDQLATNAASMAETAIAKPSAPAAQRVWNDVLEQLDVCGLSPVIYCKRTGRVIGAITPDPWTDYLDAIAGLGETVQADTMQQTLIAAIIAQKAHAVAPIVLTTSNATLAMIRETSAADFLAISMEHLFPMPRGAQSTDIAIRAEQLGQARRLMSAIPHGSMQYACECVTLYLSYIKPTKIEANRNLLSKYGFAEQTDLTAPFLSVPTLGHFCGRIIQQMIDLIQQHKLRPVKDLTQKDLLTLRVHWQGLPVYQALRNARREWRAANTYMAQNVPSVRGVGAANRRLDDISIPTGQLDTFASAFLDTLDLSAAMQAGGRSVKVVLESEKQAAAALEKHRELKAQQEQVKAANDDVELLDLSSLLVSGSLPIEMLPQVDSAHDLIEAGLIDMADLEGFGDFEDLEDDEEELTPELPSWLEAFQDDADKRTAPRRRQTAPKTITHKDAAVHAAMSAMSGGAMEIAHKEEKAKERLPMRGAKPASTPTPPATTERRPIRRIIKS